MRDKDLYAQILGIKSPWQVSGVELALSEGKITVHVEQEEVVQHCCPTCGKVSPGYDSRKRKHCQPWRAKRRLVVPSSREAALFSRRALRQRENKVALPQMEWVDYRNPL